MRVRCQYQDEQGLCPKAAVGAMWAGGNGNDRAAYRFCCKQHQDWAARALEPEEDPPGEGPPTVSWRFLEEIPAAVLVRAPHLDAE